MNLSIISAIATIIIPLLMAYVAYVFPFKTSDKKISLAGKIFGILAGLGIIAGGYMVYSNSNDSTEIIKGEKDLQLSQKDLGLAQKDVQITQLKLDLNQRHLSDSISGLKKIINNQQDFLDTIESNVGLSSRQLQSKLDILKKSNDSLRSKEIEPVLDILPDGNPILKATWHNQKDMLVIVVNEVINDAVATNLSWKGILVVLHDGTSINFAQFPDTSLKSDFIHFGKGNAIALHITAQKEVWENNNKVYICLKVSYTDKSGKPQNPLIKVYNITNDYDQRFPPTYGQDYDKVIALAKEINKSW